MPTSAECRQKADECYRMAAEAKTESDRAACLDLARTWLEASLNPDLTPEQVAQARKYELEPQPEAPPSGGLRRWLWEFFG